MARRITLPTLLGLFCSLVDGQVDVLDEPHDEDHWSQSARRRDGKQPLRLTVRLVDGIALDSARGELLRDNDGAEDGLRLALGSGG